MAVIEITSDSFEKEVLQANLPVLVDFYADWCGPCKQMAPIIAQFAEQNEGKLKVCKINVDNARDLSARYEIVYIPTLKLFKQGNVALTSVGAKGLEELTAMVGL
ncbi:MAG: thioredoxin [Eubacteriaceae bacterium]|nr:thioredoxin [Eubacteriaceae bacterium]